VRRMAAWKAMLQALLTAAALAHFVFGAPLKILAASYLSGAAFGLFPICWVILPALFLYRVSVESGQFEVIKDSIAHLTGDMRLQVLLIAFAFSAFLEGAAGFGAPVAIAGAMLAGLGLDRFQAARLCLLANTAPVAFGSIGIPVITLAGITELPLPELSAAVGRIAPLISLVIPCYLMVVFVGWQKTKPVLPAVAVVSVVFAGVQFLVANFMGPFLVIVLASVVTMIALVVLLKIWKPSDAPAAVAMAASRQHSAAAVLRAWTPYLLVVGFVLLWGDAPFKAWLDGATTLHWKIPSLHNLVERMPPVAKAAVPTKAVFDFNWLSAAGTAVFIAGVLGGFAVGLRPRALLRVFGATAKQMALPALTIASVLGFAFLMNYSGMIATLGLAVAATGRLFPFFSAFLGWLGVFVTGSDTSSNALFGNLQVVTAQTLHLSPMLTAASNAAAGGLGKMISLQSIAIVLAATGMPQTDESKLFRWSMRHSLLLTALVGLVVMLYAHVLTQVVP
ncbi:MAG: lactate permease LctP family transporter, partial [Kiritimatiellaeota bacterium]|nr:lactate permease LctP family transporter [Kiritimatiellota bacterium]